MLASTVRHGTYQERPTAAGILSPSMARSGPVAAAHNGGPTSATSMERTVSREAAEGDAAVEAAHVNGPAAVTDLPAEVCHSFGGVGWHEQTMQLRVRGNLTLNTTKHPQHYAHTPFLLDGWNAPRLRPAPRESSSANTVRPPLLRNGALSTQVRHGAHCETSNDDVVRSRHNARPCSARKPPLPAVSANKGRGCADLRKSADVDSTRERINASHGLSRPSSAAASASALVHRWRFLRGGPLASPPPTAPASEQKPQQRDRPTSGRQANTGTAGTASHETEEASSEAVMAAAKLVLQKEQRATSQAARQPQPASTFLTDTPHVLPSSTCGSPPGTAGSSTSSSRRLERSPKHALTAHVTATSQTESREAAQSQPNSSETTKARIAQSKDDCQGTLSAPSAPLEAPLLEALQRAQRTARVERRQLQFALPATPSSARGVTTSGALQASAAVSRTTRKRDTPPSPPIVDERPKESKQPPSAHSDAVSDGLAAGHASLSPLAAQAGTGHGKTVICEAPPSSLSSSSSRAVRVAPLQPWSAATGPHHTPSHLCSLPYLCAACTSEAAGVEQTAASGTAAASRSATRGGKEREAQNEEIGLPPTTAETIAPPRQFALPLHSVSPSSASQRQPPVTATRGEEEKKKERVNSAKGVLFISEEAMASTLPQRSVGVSSQQLCQPLPASNGLVREITSARRRLQHCSQPSTATSDHPASAHHLLRQLQEQRRRECGLSGGGGATASGAEGSVARTTQRGGRGVAGNAAKVPEGAEDPHCARRTAATEGKDALSVASSRSSSGSFIKEACASSSAPRQPSTVSTTATTQLQQQQRKQKGSCGGARSDGAVVSWAKCEDVDGLQHSPRDTLPVGSSTEAAEEGKVRSQDTEEFVSRFFQLVKEAANVNHYDEAAQQTLHRTLRATMCVDGVQLEHSGRHPLVNVTVSSYTPETATRSRYTSPPHSPLHRPPFIVPRTSPSSSPSSTPQRHTRAQVMCKRTPPPSHTVHPPHSTSNTRGTEAAWHLFPLKQAWSKQREREDALDQALLAVKTVSRPLPPRSSREAVQTAVSGTDSARPHSASAFPTSTAAPAATSVVTTNRAIVCALMGRDDVEHARLLELHDQAVKEMELLDEAAEESLCDLLGVSHTHFVVE